jgi:crossover junction endodeoxyribonuclease RuvC
VVGVPFIADVVEPTNVRAIACHDPVASRGREQAPELRLPSQAPLCILIVDPPIHIDRVRARGPSRGACCGVRRDAYAAPVRVVGIDPGLAACGYGVVETHGARAEALAYGCWHTEADPRVELRLRELFLALTDLLAEHEPDTVALEESFVGRDARGSLSLGQVRGALLVACVKAGYSCVEYPPARVKQAVCGYGRADKAQVQRMAKALLGLERTPTPTHAADALAVALCHATAAALLRLAG